MLQMVKTNLKGERWSQWDTEWVGDGAVVLDKVLGKGDVRALGSELALPRARDIKFQVRTAGYIEEPKEDFNLVVSLWSMAAVSFWCLKIAILFHILWSFASDYSKN